jgi:hypothetical protein
MMEMWRPIASFALNPYSRSAPGFHDKIVPSRLFDRIASCESDTIAASQLDRPARDHRPNPRPRPANSPRFTKTPFTDHLPQKKRARPTLPAAALVALPRLRYVHSLGAARYFVLCGAHRLVELGAGRLETR